MNYFNKRDLHFNTDKTEIIRVHPRQANLQHINTCVGNNKVTTTHKPIKFLDLHLDENLNWNHHCQQLSVRGSLLNYFFFFHFYR